jgi:Flp pilus assembly pilin Flp
MLLSQTNLLDKVGYNIYPQERSGMRLKGGVKMELVTKMFIRARESVVRNTRGQTMTEYALILAAIAVVVYGTYKALGNNIGSLANGVDSTLTNA